MVRLEDYFKRVMEFPGVVRHPEEAKYQALADAGSRVLHQEQSDFQRILYLETPRGETMLTLDGELQFYSGDEHRYHESLAVVPFLFLPEGVRRVAVMGGGDGLIARELVRHFGGELESIEVIDIDPAVTRLATTHPRMLELNRRSLLDDRVRVVNADATRYRGDRSYDLIICDLPDPTNEALAGLYTREYYRHLESQLAPGGLMALQIVYFQPLFDGLLATLRSAFPEVLEYSVEMYSFVRCGFCLCGRERLERQREIPQGTRFLTPEVLDWLFYFPPDEPRLRVEEISTADEPRVLAWYREFLRDQFEERILFY